MQDYLLTGKYMLTEESLRRARADWQRLTGSALPPDDATLRALFSMDAEPITAVFETIERGHGSFDAFVRDALKLTSGDITALRARLLE